jgi:hypothetical protein
VIVAIDSEALGEPTSFTLRSEGSDYEIFIDPGRDYQFPLAHLNEHLQLSLPVRCDLEPRDGKLYARTIEDA